MARALALLAAASAVACSGGGPVLVPVVEPVRQPILPGPPAGTASGAIAGAILRLADYPRFAGGRAIFDAPAEPADLAEAATVVRDALAHAQAEAGRLGTASIESSGQEERFGCGTVFESHLTTGAQKKTEYLVYRWQIVVVSRGEGAKGYETARREFWLPARIRLEGPFGPIEFDRSGRPSTRATIRVVRIEDGQSTAVEVGGVAP